MEPRCPEVVGTYTHYDVRKENGMDMDSKPYLTTDNLSHNQRRYVQGVWYSTPYTVFTSTGVLHSQCKRTRSPSCSALLNQSKKITRFADDPKSMSFSTCSDLVNKVVFPQIWRQTKGIFT